MLWLAAALSAIAFSIAATVRNETDRAAADSEGMRAHYLASGSIDRAILWIEWSVRNYRNPDGSPRYFEAPMPYLRYDYPSGSAIVEVAAETAKMNINMVNLQDLTALLVNCGAEQDAAIQIAANIIAWRNGDPNVPSIRFSIPDPTFRPRHASFEEIEDVLLVSGMTPELFYGKFDRDPQGRLVPRGGLRDAITTFNTEGMVDANSASPALLGAMGVPPVLIQQIVTLRPFKNMEDLNARVPGLPPGRIQIVTGPKMIWSLRATARLRLAPGKYSETVRSVSAVLSFLKDAQPQGPGYHILRWRDEAPSLAALPF